MTCSSCGSSRIATVSGQCVDVNCSVDDREFDGYIPDGLHVGAIDYIDLVFCMDCGKIQGEFPTEVIDCAEDDDDSEVVGDPSDND